MLYLLVVASQRQTHSPWSAMKEAIDVLHNAQTAHQIVTLEPKHVA